LIILAKSLRSAANIATEPYCEIDNRFGGDADMPTQMVPGPETTNRDINVVSITDAALQAWQATPDERLKYLLERLVSYVHDYAREVRLTHDEWQSALQFVSRCGQISDEHRNEFSLLSDVLGLTSLVDLLEGRPGITSGSVLGPFYAPGSPQLPLGADLAKGNPGDVVLVSGRVMDIEGRAIQGASIDLWQTDAKGLYATQDPSQPDENFRCRQDCDTAGRYWFTTVLPAPYTIPTDGPIGDLFRMARRSPWRPAHFHFIVRAPGYRSIVTELFFSHDKFIEDDAVFGVRADLIRNVEDVDARQALPAPLARTPEKRVDFDFIIMPAG
jgi:hydroxyquinol 1,2-dioxygenase